MDLPISTRRFRRKSPPSEVIPLIPGRIALSRIIRDPWGNLFITLKGGILFPWMLLSLKCSQPSKGRITFNIHPLWCHLYIPAPLGNLVFSTKIKGTTLKITSCNNLKLPGQKHIFLLIHTEIVIYIYIIYQNFGSLPYTKRPQVINCVLLHFYTQFPFLIQSS
jgi:hypothetical protein